MFRRLLPLITPAALLVLAGSAHAQNHSTWWLPDNLTVGGQKIDEIFNLILIITGVAFILVAAAMIWFLIRYRHRPGVKAIYNHGNNQLEVIWTVIPAIIFIIIGVISWDAWRDLQQRPVPENALKLDIVGYQFLWSVRYQGNDGQFGNSTVPGVTMTNKHGLVRDDEAWKDDVVLDNAEFLLPVGRPIHLILRSADVIHSVYIPHFRLYQDVVPGSEIAWVWFETTGTRDLELACSQLCGRGHYSMKAKFRVVEEEEFNAWLKQKSTEALAANQELETTATAAVPAE